MFASMSHCLRVSKKQRHTVKYISVRQPTCEAKKAIVSRGRFGIVSLCV